MPEADLHDGVPQTAGWFVLNLADAPWQENALRTVCKLGGEGPAHFDDLGVGVYHLDPGQAMALYHHEAGQEDFLVLDGTGLLIADGVERGLRRWDLVHCPPGTAHTIVATDQPCLVFAVGARKERGSARYPYEPLAASRNAGVASDGASPDEAYAAFGRPRRRPAPELP